MSTTSTVTTLVACNHIPGDEVELLNCMFVLVLTRGDGTPFDAISIQEEEIMELCIELGQTHPEDVLWYSVADLVVLFHSADKMLVMAHGVIKGYTLPEEPIWLHTSPPLPPHVRAYVVVRDGEPSGTQSLTPDREEVPHHPLVIPTQMGGPHISFRWILGTLGMPR